MAPTAAQEETRSQRRSERMSDWKMFGFFCKIKVSMHLISLWISSSWSASLYDKGDPESPSLESAPLPDDDRLRIASEFRIVPHGDGGHYLLVALCDKVKLKDYMFHIFFMLKLSCMLFRPFKGNMPHISLFWCSELHMVLFMVSVASNRDIRFLYLPIWSYLNL
uniref:Uncharacterized protein n=1 Tax=Zea mays TaxID=4577 RepID=A0A804MIM1_MAIZE